MTFLNAAFLFAAFAALVPLVIHLISRRRVETVDWSSLRFLKELERRRIRRIRIRQILLLVIRSLIILCVALALARPTLEGPLAGANARARTSIAIVVDNSASMGRSAGGRTLLDGAVARIREVTGLLDEGDEAFLVSAARPATSLIPDGTVSPDVVLRELETVSITSRATDMPGGVELALEHLAEARNLNREIYLLGDVARSGWTGPPDVPRVTGETASWPPRAYVVPFIGADVNVSVTAVSVERVYGGAPGRYTVSAEVVNVGPRPVEVPTRLFVDGVQVGQSGVRVEAGRGATARFSVTLDGSAWHEGSVTIERDAFPADDERYFVIPPSRTIEVLVVRPDGAGEDAVYLEHALDPTGGSGRFRPVAAAARDIERQEHGRFPVVVLADIGALGAAAERWLRRHVESGGGLLLVLGSRTDVRAFDGSALSDLSGLDVVGPVDRARGLRLAPAGRGHPLLEGLVSGDRLIEDVLVRRALQARESGETVLELPGIGPALAFSESDGGPVATLLFGLDPDASDLARSGLVVPLFHRVVERLAGPAPGVAAGTAGYPLDLDLATTPAGRVELIAPDGTTTTISTAGASATIEDTDVAGIYRLESGGGTVAMAAIGIDRGESSLAAAEVSEIQEWFAGLPVTFIGEGEAVADAVLMARRGRELWRVFLYAALALLAIEMVIARPRSA